MNRSRPAVVPGTPGSPIAAQAEGYLLLRAERERAREEARRLCAALPWLTDGQAEDLSRQYIRQRLELTGRLLRTTVRRAEELRHEYEGRYRRLRRDLLRRHTAWAAGVIAAATAAGTLAAQLAR